jgi:argininosuccinate lyase
VVGRLVLEAESAGVELSALPQSSFTAAHPLLTAEAVADALSAEASVRRREVAGGTGPTAVAEQLEAARLALFPRRETPRGNELVLQAG